MTAPSPFVLVRFRVGIVGETRRTTHLVEIPPEDLPSTPVTIGDHIRVITALCGQSFAPGEAELLPRLMGMPCEACLRRSPTNTYWDVAADSTPRIAGPRPRLVPGLFRTSA